jgi:hypothetical protein
MNTSALSVEEGNKSVKPKIVNHGNVFGTKNWYTFYCGNCGIQLVHGQQKCKGSNSFTTGCGTLVDWEQNQQ